MCPFVGGGGGGQKWVLDGFGVPFGVPLKHPQKGALEKDTPICQTGANENSEGSSWPLVSLELQDALDVD